MGVFEVAVLVIVEGVGVACIVAMWRGRPRDPARKKVAWTFLLLIPVFGPLLWGAYYGGPPSRNRPGNRSTASGWFPHFVDRFWPGR